MSDFRKLGYVYPFMINMFYRERSDYRLTQLKYELQWLIWLNMWSPECLCIEVEKTAPNAYAYVLIYEPLPVFLIIKCLLQVFPQQFQINKSNW